MRCDTCSRSSRALHAHRSVDACGAAATPP
jgi:hypothetical protein